MFPAAHHGPYRSKLQPMQPLQKPAHSTVSACAFGSKKFYPALDGYYMYSGGSALVYDTTQSAAFTLSTSATPSRISLNFASALGTYHMYMNNAPLFNSLRVHLEPTPTGNDECERYVRAESTGKYLCLTSSGTLDFTCSNVAHAATIRFTEAPEPSSGGGNAGGGGNGNGGNNDKKDHKKTRDSLNTFFIVGAAILIFIILINAGLVLYRRQRAQVQ